MNFASTVTALPPGLAGNAGTDSSKASTSSAPSSFQLDDGGGILNGMDDLEEIGLDDENELDRGRRQDRVVKHESFHHKNPMRDLTHSQNKRPPYPSLQTGGSTGHSNNFDHLATPRTSGRSRQSQSKSATRQGLGDESPALSFTMSTASPGIGPPAVPTGHRTRASPVGPKRTSWQRKTSDQLEEEYDSDDEVPPEAIFYNVPLSPRSSRAFSKPTSPERESSSDRSESNGTLTPPATRHSSTSAIPIKSAIERTVSEQQRSKSWSDAVLHLGEEARELSEALERHADKELLRNGGRLHNKRLSAPVQKPILHNPISLDKLPPLQIASGILDPLPMSKEKEAVLSRTRPSWLPPKPKEEEKRHLKEYQKMMRRSQEAERKRAQREQLEQAAKDQLNDEVSGVWETKIIPDWNRMSRIPETRELWWKGVAPRCRGQVWTMAFGNPLAVSSDTFLLALKRAKEIEAGLKKAPSMYTAKERELFVAIRRDIKRTFPELKIFQENGPLYEALMDILMAYSMYRSDVGYVYGTHTVAAMLLLNQSPAQAFITLANMLNRSLPLAFFTQDEGAIARSYNLFLKAFKYKLPSLYQHIHEALKIDPMLYLEPMFLSLFSLYCPIDITSRIWDVYCFEGDSFLVRTAVAILAVMESKLYGDRQEVLNILGWHATEWSLGKEDDFMGAVRSAGKEDVHIKINGKY